MRRAWAGMVVLVLGFIAGPARTQERPQLQPIRDVAVTYRLEGAAADVLPGGAPGDRASALRLFWDAAGQRLRVEAGRPQALLVDLRNRDARVVDTGLRSAITLPMRDADLQALTLSGVTLARRGQETIAGLPCTVWAAQDRRGAGTVCFTTDGVPLRASGEIDGRRGSFTATTVEYGTQPAELFRVPPGFMSLSVPSFGRPR